MDHTTAAAAAAAVDATLYHHQANPQALLSSQVSPNSAINTEHYDRSRPLAAGMR